MSKAKKKLLIYVGLAALAFLLLVSRIPGLAGLKFAAADTVSLPVRIVTFPFVELKKMFLYHYSFAQARRLEKEVKVLNARLTAMDEVVKQNTRFEKLLDFKQKVQSAVAANVISRDPSNWDAAVIIDKGAKSGIKIGMPVVDASGIIGKVSQVSSGRAKIILLSDPAFGVPAMVRRSREIGLVSGTLTGQSRMRYLSADADVVVGDEIISSKLSSSFPEGLLVGTVVAVERASGSPFPSCLIRPAAPLSAIEEVLVILDTPS